MKGQRIGYIRVSSYDQNPERQLEGETLDKVFTDKASGKDVDRPQLKELINFAREGDFVIVHSMDRLARNVDDLRNLVNGFTKKGIAVQFLKECLVFKGDDSPMSQLLLSVVGAFAQFERSLIKERQREGIELAKKRGAYKGRKKSLSEEDVIRMKEKLANGVTKTYIAKEFGISRETLYQYLRINS